MARPSSIGKRVAIVASVLLVIALSIAVARSVARSTPRLDLALRHGGPGDDVALAIAPQGGGARIVTGGASPSVLRVEGRAIVEAKPLAGTVRAAAVDGAGRTFVIAGGELLRDGVRLAAVASSSGPALVTADDAGGAVVATSGDHGATLARVDGNGVATWTRALPRLPTSIAIAFDRVVVTVVGTPKELDAPGEHEARTTLLAIDAQGATAFVKPLGQGSDRVEAIVARTKEGVAAIGRFEGRPTIDGLALVPTGPDDAFVARVDDAGVFHELHAFGLSFRPAHVAAVAGADLYVVGRRAEDGGAFVARVTLAGRVKWIQAVGGPSVTIEALAVDDRERALVAGSFEHDLRLARLRLHAEGGRDVFVARFGP